MEAFGVERVGLTPRFRQKPVAFGTRRNPRREPVWDDF